jgi:predicted MFS family arabinose efflux permease
MAWRGGRLLRAALSNRDLARLEAVWAITALAKWALAILVALYAYRLHGAGAVGLAALIRMAPAAFLAPRLAVVVDRCSRRSVLLVSAIARCALATGMTLVVWRDGSLVVLLALAACYAAADTVQKPAQAALLPVYSRNPGELAAANAIWSMLDNGGFLIGSVAVGLFVGAAGLAAAFLSCAVALAMAALLLSELRSDPAAPLLAVEAGESAFRAGLRAVRTHADLRVLLELFGVGQFVEGMVDVLLVVAALALLDLGEEGAGWLNAAWGLGGIAGGLAATALLVHGRLARGLSLGFALAGLPLVTIALWPHADVALAVLVVLGLGYGMVEVALLTLTQRLVAADILGRVYGLHEALGTAALAIGSLAAGVAVDLWGARVTLVLTGVLLPVLALPARRRLRTTAAGRTPAPGRYERLRGVHLFASLPVATVESLALRATRLQAPAGSTLVAAGEPGDAFYVIDDGAVDVFDANGFRRTELAGDYFGEIALVRDTPRTATVVAQTPVALLALDRAEFLAAIGSHPASRQGLHKTVALRLDEVGGDGAVA